MKLSLFLPALLVGASAAKPFHDFGRRLAPSSSEICPEATWERCGRDSSTDSTNPSKCDPSDGSCNIFSSITQDLVPTKDGSLSGDVSGVVVGTATGSWDAVLGNAIAGTLPEDTTTTDGDVTTPGSTTCPSVPVGWICRQVCNNGDCAGGKTPYGYAVYGTFCNPDGQTVLFGLVLRTVGDWDSKAENTWVDFAYDNIKEVADQVVEGANVDTNEYAHVYNPKQYNAKIGFAFKLTIPEDILCNMGRSHYNDESTGSTVADAAQKHLACFIFPVCPKADCGTGVLDAGETCEFDANDVAFPLDGGSIPSGSTCRRPNEDNPCTYCGDGIVQDVEECDPAVPEGSPSYKPNCLPDCTLHPCGDGVVSPELGETCDPEAQDDPNAAVCREYGTPDACTYCGDGVKQTSEVCEYTIDSECTAACIRTGTTGAVCGNGDREDPETCDGDDFGDAVVPAGTVCRDTCSYCGDGTQDSEETCEPPGVGFCNDECCDVCKGVAWSQNPPTSDGTVCGADVLPLVAMEYEDPCSDAIVKVDGARDPASGFHCGGLVTDTWSTCGGALMYERVTTVEDNPPALTLAPPDTTTVVFTCPTKVTDNAWTINTIEDDCSTLQDLTVTYPTVPVVPDVSCGSTGSLTWVLTDECSNTDTQTRGYVVTCCEIRYTQPPPTTVSCDSEIPNTPKSDLDAEVWCYDSAVSDFTYSHPAVVGDRSNSREGEVLKCNEELTYEWNLSDSECAQTTHVTVTQTISVINDDPPTIVPDELGSVFSCPANVDLGATAEDTCGEVVTVADATLSTRILCSADTLLTWTATDVCDNTATKTKAVSICCEFTISDAFSGVNIDVTIRLEIIPDGVRFTVFVTDPDTFTGDLRGVFFEMDDTVDLTLVSITGADVNSVVIGRDSVQKIAGDVRMTGDGNIHVYDAGVEIGTQGKGKDDISSTTFEVIGGDVTFESIVSGEFGLRLTSVGAPGGGREESSKVTGYSPCCTGGPGGPGGPSGPGPEPEPEPEPEPTPTPLSCVVTCPGSAEEFTLDDVVVCPAPSPARNRRLGSNNATPLFF